MRQKNAGKGARVCGERTSDSSLLQPSMAFYCFCGKSTNRTYKAGPCGPGQPSPLSAPGCPCALCSTHRGLLSAPLLALLSTHLPQDVYYVLCLETSVSLSYSSLRPRFRHHFLGKPSLLSLLSQVVL